jgi:hypothetical protein
MLGLPGFLLKGIVNDSIATIGVTANGQAGGTSSVIDGNAYQPVAEYLAGTQTAELGERFSGLKMLAVTNIRLKLL